MSTAVPKRTIGRLASEFLDGRGLRTSSRRAYRDRLRAVFASVWDEDPKRLTAAAALSLLEEAEEGRSDSTCALTRRVLRQFEAWLRRDRHVTAAWFDEEDLRGLPTAERQRHATESEVDAIVEAAGDDRSFVLAYQLLRATGARPSELCAARGRNLSGQPGRRKIELKEHKTSGKDPRPRRIVIGPSAEPFLEESLRGLKLRSDTPLLRTRTGRPWSRPHLSRTFRRYRDAAGVPSCIVLYCTRHEAGTAIVKKHGLAAGAAILGHASTKTTERYTRFSDEDLFGFSA